MQPAFKQPLQCLPCGCRHAARQAEAPVMNEACLICGGRSSTVPAPRQRYRHAA